jgi:hypothetical protein
VVDVCGGCVWLSVVAVCCGCGCVWLYDCVLWLWGACVWMCEAVCGECVYGGCVAARWLCVAECVWMCVVAVCG